MAARIAAKEHDTIRDAAKDILKHSDRHNILWLRVLGKTAVLEAANGEVIQKAVKQN